MALSLSVNLCLNAANGTRHLVDSIYYVETNLNTYESNPAYVGGYIDGIKHANIKGKISDPFGHQYSAIYIAGNVFLNCNTLRSVSINNGIKYTLGYSFAGCPSLQTVVVNGTTFHTIGEGCFKNCPWLSSVTLQLTNLREIGREAFANCPMLTSINIDRCITVGESAFSNCTSLTSIKFSAEKISAYACYNCTSLTELTLYDGVKEIGSSAFQNCSSLDSITIPSTTTRINYSAFDGCSSLTTIEIPNSTTYIDYDAFSNCVGLLSISLGENLTHIGTGAFSNCTNVKKIVNYRDLPASLNSDPFRNIDKSTCVLYVPASSINLYKNANIWKDFYRIRAIGDELESYTVTFCDYDNTILSQQIVYEGENAVAPSNPHREGYTFIGWNLDYTNITSDVTIKAQYKINRYKVTFKNWDGTIIKIDSVAYQSTPIPPTNPERTATAEFTYTFANWTPDIVAATCDAIYTATYTSSRNSYTITWNQDDGTIIDQTIVEYGQVPTHENVTKDATVEYTYTFAGWLPKIVAVTEDAIYTATYNSIVNKYTITFKNDDGSVLCANDLEYGMMPFCEEPTKEDDEQYSYKFAGWSPDIVVVTADATYTATYTTTPKSLGIEDVQRGDVQYTKVVRNGHVFILRSDKTYTLQGAEVR